MDMSSQEKQRRSRNSFRHTWSRFPSPVCCIGVYVLKRCLINKHESTHEKVWFTFKDTLIFVFFALLARRSPYNNLSHPTPVIGVEVCCVAAILKFVSKRGDRSFPHKGHPHSRFNADKSSKFQPPAVLRLCWLIQNIYSTNTYRINLYRKYLPERAINTAKWLLMESCKQRLRERSTRVNNTHVWNEVISPWVLSSWATVHGQLFAVDGEEVE